MAIKFNRSQTFATNGTVTAAGLHNLIDGTDIYQALITDQPSLSNVATDDSILIADASLTAGDAPRQTTVSNLFDDALTAGTYTNMNLTGALTYGTATGNRTVSTSATITTGTIRNLTAGTTTSTAATITTGTIPTLTAGTTTSTAANITNGTIQTLTSSTATITGGTFSGSVNSTSGTIGTLNTTTGTISNLSTTLAGDFTISQGTGTIGTGTITAAKLANPQYTGFRNRIINGDMRIDQRNAGASTTLSVGNTYSVDRWLIGVSGASVTGQRVSGSGSFKNALRITGGASNTGVFISQRIEAQNSYDLISSSVAVKCRLSASAITSVTWTAYYANSEDTFSSVTQIATGTISGISSTAGDYTFTFNAGANAGNGLQITFTLGTMTSGTFDITGVQLEAGSTATDFERRPYGTELALCQRYYQVGGNGASGNSSNMAATSWTCEAGLTFPVEMRATPNGSLTTQSIIVYVGGGYGSTSSTCTLTSQTYNTRGAVFQLTANWGANTTYDQRGARIRTNCIAFDAEL